MSTVQRDIHASMRGILVDWLVEVALVRKTICAVSEPALCSHGLFDSLTSCTRSC